MPTGRSYRVPVECIDIDHEVQPGSRLGVAVAADNTDSVRRDPDGVGTHEVVLGAPDGDGGTSLRLPITGGLDSIEAGATTLPDVAVSRSDDGSAFYGGQTNQVDITLTEADTEAVVRDTIPFGWEIVAGDSHTTYTEDGERFIQFDAAASAGGTRTYFAEAPGSTGAYEFGPGRGQAADGSTVFFDITDTETNAVGGVDTS